MRKKQWELNYPSDLPTVLTVAIRERSHESTFSPTMDEPLEIGHVDTRSENWLELLH